MDYQPLVTRSPRTTMGADVVLQGSRGGADRYLVAGDADNTVRAYLADWHRFQRWCDARGLTTLPATTDTLLAYLSEMADTLLPDGTWAYAPSTISRHRATIDRVHREAGIEAPGRQQSVTTFMRGLGRLRAHRTVRKAPVLLDDVHAAVDAIPRMTRPGAALGRRDRMLLLLGFAGAFRRSEIASLTVGDVKYVRRDGLEVYLASSKTDKSGKGQVKAIPFGRSRDTCVVCAYVEWMQMLAEPWLAVGDGDIDPLMPEPTQHVCKMVGLAGIRDVDPSLPFLRSVLRSGMVSDRGITGATVARVVKERCAVVGIDPETVSGHSLRAGFVTQARRNGADIDSIMKQSGHRSRTQVEAYVRGLAPLEGNAVNDLGL